MAVEKQTWIAVLFAIVFPTLVTWIYFIHFDGRSPGIAGVGKAIQFAFPACWFFLWMKYSIRETGLPESECHSLRWSVRASLVFGLVSGIAIVATMFLYYQLAIDRHDLEHLATEIERRVHRLSLANPAGYAALGMFYSLAHSLMEEYYFRWFVFGRLRRLVRFVPAAVVSGVAFMSHHVIVLYVFFGFSFHTCLLSLSIAVGGVIWAWHYERSRSLLGPWLSHLLVDAGIFLLGYHLIFVVAPTVTILT